MSGPDGSPAALASGNNLLDCRHGDDTAGWLRYLHLVPVVRRFLAQRYLVALLCAATLLLKLLVPAGYMVGNENGRITIELCSGVASRPMTMAMPGMHGDMIGHGKSQDHGKAEMPCAFTALSAISLGAIDPIQLVALVAFVMAAGLLPVVLPAAVRPSYLRPPLRGPPLTL
ncbi:MAG: DUF2946 family protein [Janthinobacterium lividum]